MVRLRCEHMVGVRMSLRRGRAWLSTAEWFVRMEEGEQAQAGGRGERVWSSGATLVLSLEK